MTILLAENLQFALADMALLHVGPIILVIVIKLLLIYIAMVHYHLPKAICKVPKST